MDVKCIDEECSVFFNVSRLPDLTLSFEDLLTAQPPSVRFLTAVRSCSTGPIRLAKSPCLGFSVRASRVATLKRKQNIRIYRPSQSIVY